MDDDILVKARSLTVDFADGGAVFRALDHVDLTIHKKEFVSAVGVSGSGKTTLLNTIGGLISPVEGSVLFRDVNLNAMSDEGRTIFRRENIGFIFQNYNLIPSLNVFENICFSAQLSGKTVDINEVNELAERLGIDDQLFKLPSALSGGQQQRAAIARAMLAKPALLLADEPTGNLDSAAGRTIMELLREAVEQEDMSVLMVTHNEEFASLTDRILHIEDGKIAAEETKK